MHDCPPDYQATYVFSSQLHKLLAPSLLTCVIANFTIRLPACLLVTSPLPAAPHLSRQKSHVKKSVKGNTKFTDTRPVISVLAFIPNIIQLFLFSRYCRCDVIRTNVKAFSETVPPPKCWGKQEKELVGIYRKLTRRKRVKKKRKKNRV